MLPFDFVAVTLHRLRAETPRFHQNPSFSSFSVTLHHIYSCCYTLNKLDALTNGNYTIIETLGPLVAPSLHSERYSLGPSGF